MTFTAITYSRVSTTRQADSGISLEEQDKATTALIARKGWALAGQFIDAGKSGKSMTGRPELARALEMLKAGQANALVVAKLDRLARSTVDLAGLMNTALKENWALVVLDLDVDTSTPSGELLAGIVGTVAQYERRIIGERAKMTHSNRKARGLRAGQKPLLAQATRQAIADSIAKGMSLRQVVKQLNDSGVPTAKGGLWRPSTVAHIVKSVALDAELAQVA